MFRRGMWVVHHDAPAIIVELEGAEAVLHFVDENGDTLMFASEHGKKTIVERVHVDEIARCPVDLIPKSRRPQ